MKARALFGASAFINWGTKAKKNRAILGLRIFVRIPCVYTFLNETFFLSQPFEFH